MFESPGALLRAWRRVSGRTQADVAEAVHVTVAAVSAWETGARGISRRSFEQIDAALGAGGCLVGLARAIGSRGLEPRAWWGHVFHGQPGPVWVWIRPPRGCRLRGLAGFRILSCSIDHEVGPAGLFMVAPWSSPHWDVEVVMEEPVWADFGRGVPPAWLGVPVVSSVALRDVVLRRPGDRLVDFIGARSCRRGRGGPAVLRDVLRSLLDGERWDELEEQWRRGADAPVPAAGAAPDGPAPPRTAEDQRALHRRLRVTRGLTQADAAAAARALRAQDPVASAAVPDGPVTAMQIHNYEAGRSSRVQHLPALLDMAYDAFGWSCFERVRVTRPRANIFTAQFPDFWIGPVTFTARPMAPDAAAGPVTAAWSARCLALTLPTARPAQGVPFGCLRLPGDGNLSVQLPTGWTLQAWMGFHPGAQRAVNDWVPVSPEAGDAVFGRLIATLPRVLGIAEDDLRRALAG